jgi:hypothetical protein
MKLEGITLAETVISLAIISVIALSTSVAFSSSGNIFRRSADIQSDSERTSRLISDLYCSDEIAQNNSCFLKINDDIILSGELLNVSSDNSDNGFSGYLAVRPYKRSDEIADKPDEIETDITEEITSETE